MHTKCGDYGWEKRKAVPGWEEQEQARTLYLLKSSGQSLIDSWNRLKMVTWKLKTST